MNNNEGYIRHNGFNLYYKRYGSGPNVLLAFHGFDESHEDMQALAFALEGVYTVYAFDIFFHGNSFIDNVIDDPVIEGAEFADLIQFFLHRHQIKKASVLGHALGGKLAMSLVEVMPYKFENLYLVSSEGFNQSLWNNFVARTGVGQYIFEKVIHHPEMFVRLAGIMQRLKLLPAKIHSFLQLQLESDANRKKVYDVLLLFRELRPDLGRVRKTIKRYDINMVVIVGKNDELVPPQPAIDFMAKVNESNLHILHFRDSLLLHVDELGNIIKNNSLHTVSWEMKPQRR